MLVSEKLGKGLTVEKQVREIHSEAETSQGYFNTIQRWLLFASIVLSKREKRVLFNEATRVIQAIVDEGEGISWPQTA